MSGPFAFYKQSSILSYRYQVNIFVGLLPTADPQGDKWEYVIQAEAPEELTADILKDWSGRQVQEWLHLGLVDHLAEAAFQGGAVGVQKTKPEAKE